jgi:hypothetical protein
MMARLFALFPPTLQSLTALYCFLAKFSRWAIRCQSKDVHGNCSQWQQEAPALLKFGKANVVYWRPWMLQMSLMKKRLALPLEKFENMTDGLGEGFQGEDYNVQIKVINTPSSGKLLRASSVDCLTMLEGDREDDGNLLDLEEQADHAEEEDKARKAFDQLAQT